MSESLIYTLYLRSYLLYQQHYGYDREQVRSAHSEKQVSGSKYEETPRGKKRITCCLAPSFKYDLKFL